MKKIGPNRKITEIGDILKFRYGDYTHLEHLLGNLGASRSLWSPFATSMIAVCSK